jgi:hypothetical protein
MSTTRPCRGPSRRDALRVGMLAALGLGVDDLFRLRAMGSGPSGHVTPVAARAKSCILIWLAGGPSHVDTFDPKPDAPAEIRGEFKVIESAVPGLQLSEVFPGIAQQMGMATLIRGVTSPEGDHDRAAHHLLTGYRPNPALTYPSFGSVSAKLSNDSSRQLPSYVAVPDAPLFSSSGYLTPAFDPFSINGDPNSPGFRVRDLTPPDRLTLDRLRRRRSMVHRLDGFAGEVGQSPLTVSRDRFSERAYDLLTSNAAQLAFKVDAETPETRERYGRNTLGQGCLLARRLVEAGVPFVTVNDRGPGQLGWDTHQENFKRIRDDLAPRLDRGVGALLADLQARGMLESTLVVVMGEFGRTPKINPNAGRDHHGRANCALLAGGGIPRGLLLGRTDAKADSPLENPVTPADLAAVIYSQLGISPDLQFETPDGRPIRLVDGGKVPKELA